MSRITATRVVSAQDYLEMVDDPIFKKLVQIAEWNARVDDTHYQFVTKVKPLEDERRRFYSTNYLSNLGTVVDTVINVPAPDEMRESFVHMLYLSALSTMQQITSGIPYTPFQKEELVAIGADYIKHKYTPSD
ncbi:MAG TPA: hypothetical protein VGF14_00670 [Alphaproteobacteria bacterium]